jgi:acyl-CoA synthetase (AMP-forming)/AMP-acid ligase II
VCRRTGHTMVGVRLLPLPQYLIHLSSQFAAPKPNLPILGSYDFWLKITCGKFRKKRAVLQVGRYQRPESNAFLGVVPNIATGKVSKESLRDIRRALPHPEVSEDTTL